MIRTAVYKALTMYRKLNLAHAKIVLSGQEFICKPNGAKAPTKENQMKTKPEPKIVSTREYKHDRAMLEAIKRIGDHPKPISITSALPEFVHLKGNK